VMSWRRMLLEAMAWLALVSVLWALAAASF
jgi:hypothetical protein